MGFSLDHIGHSGPAAGTFGFLLLACVCMRICMYVCKQIYAYWMVCVCICVVTCMVTCVCSVRVLCVWGVCVWGVCVCFVQIYNRVFSLSLSVAFSVLPLSPRPCTFCLAHVLSFACSLFSYHFPSSPLLPSYFLRFCLHLWTSQDAMRYHYIVTPWMDWTLLRQSHTFKASFVNEGLCHAIHRPRHSASIILDTFLWWLWKVNDLQARCICKFFRKRAL